MYEFFCCCRQHTNNTSVKTGRRVFIETSKPKEERNKKRKKKSEEKYIQTHTQHDGKGFSVHLRDIPSFTAWRMGSKRKEPTEHSSILMTFH